MSQSHRDIHDKFTEQVSINICMSCVYLSFKFSHLQTLLLVKPVPSLAVCLHRLVLPKSQSLGHGPSQQFLPCCCRSLGWWWDEIFSCHDLFFSISVTYFSEKAMATHSSTLAWKLPWMEEPGRLQSMESWRVRHDWATSLSLVTFMNWRRKCQPTPVFLPGESQGRGSLVGCCLWGHTESDTTEMT